MRLEKAAHRARPHGSCVHNGSLKWSQVTRVARSTAGNGEAPVCDVSAIKEGQLQVPEAVAIQQPLGKDVLVGGSAVSEASTAQKAELLADLLLPDGVEEPGAAGRSEGSAL